MKKLTLFSAGLDVVCAVTQGRHSNATAGGGCTIGIHNVDTSFDIEACELTVTWTPITRPTTTT